MGQQCLQLFDILANNLDKSISLVTSFNSSIEISSKQKVVLVTSMKH